MRTQRARAAQPEPRKKSPGEIGEIIEKIVQYLPPEDIVRFRRVSQKWLGLIDAAGSLPIRSSLFLDKTSRPLRLQQTPQSNEQVVTANTAIFCPASTEDDGFLWLSGPRYEEIRLADGLGARYNMFLTDPPVERVEVALAIEFEAETHLLRQVVLRDSTFDVYKLGGLRYSDLIAAICDDVRDLRVQVHDDEPVMDLARTEVRFENVRFSNWVAGPRLGKERVVGDPIAPTYFLKPRNAAEKVLLLRHLDDVEKYVPEDDETDDDDVDEDDMEDDQSDEAEEDEADEEEPDEQEPGEEESDEEDHMDED